MGREPCRATTTRLVAGQECEVPLWIRTENAPGARTPGMNGAKLIRPAESASGA